MRVNCPNCGHKALITSRDEQSSQSARLYCICLDSRNCGATFSMILAFEHYQNPPLNHTHAIVRTLVRQLPENEQQELFKDLK